MELKENCKSLKAKKQSLKQTIDDHQKQFANQMSNQEKELGRILSIANQEEQQDDDLARSKNVKENDENANEEKKLDDDGGRDDGGRNEEGRSVESSPLKALAKLVEDLTSQKESLETSRVEIQGQLKYKEDMIRHVNQLLAQRDGEIESLDRQLTEKGEGHKNATSEISALQKEREETLTKLSSVRNEVNRLTKVSQKQHKQIEKSKRTIRIQEKRLASIKSLVSSLNFNIASWDDDKINGDDDGDGDDDDDDDDEGDDDDDDVVNIIASSQSSVEGGEEEVDQEGDEDKFLTAETITDVTTN